MILVVDDQELVCEGIRRMLEAAGFAAVTALSGRTGIALFRRHASEIRAVLLDLRLPGESAAAAFDEMRRIRPDIPVILFSGTPEEVARRELARAGLAGFLQKPFGFEQLIRKLRDVLEEEPGAGDRRAAADG